MNDKNLTVRGIGIVTTAPSHDSPIIRWDWIKCEDQMPKEGENVLAVCKSVKGRAYSLQASGWFRDTIYACRIYENQFVIESHGPYLLASHWMPLPPLPE